MKAKGLFKHPGNAAKKLLNEPGRVSNTAVISGTATNSKNERLVAASGKVFIEE